MHHKIHYQTLCSCADLPMDAGMKTPRLPSPYALLGLALVLFAACSSGPEVTQFRPPAPAITAEPVVINAATGTPEQVEANWKERLAQPYLFVEHTGDYRELGQSMRRILDLAGDRGWSITGPPFSLFYDDPGVTSVEALRARACVPVDEDVRLRPSDVGFEVLPRAMVVYTRVSGAYPQLSRVYPALFGYLQGLGWVAGGPIRELYLTNPADVESFEELLGEVQIPWNSGR
jgi:effector-binding domain-containing protein